MRFEGLVPDSFVHVLGWSLLHSLWQGAAVALAVAAVFALLPRQRASLRYAVAYAGLLLTFILPATTVWRLASSEPFELGPAATRAALAGTGVAITLGEPPRAWPAVEILLPWLVAGWALGVLFHSVRFAGGYAQVIRLQRQGVSAPDPWQEVFAGLVRRLRIRTPVRLLASTKILVPAACGWLRPVVIVPASALTAIPIEQLESILAHELAHIRRHDYLLNLVQSVIETLLFYHPGVRWLSARIYAERENCCDDIAASSCDPRIYARALAGLEHLRSGAMPLPAMAATGGSLLQRIRRLIAPAPPDPGIGPQLAAAVLLLSMMSLGGLGLAVHAQLPASGAGGVPREVAATLRVKPYSLAEEMRLEQACGDSGKLRLCADPAAGEARLECVPASPLALVLWSLGERPLKDDGVERIVRETPVPAPAARGSNATLQRTMQEQEFVGSQNLPRCSGQP